MVSAVAHGMTEYCAYTVVGNIRLSHEDRVLRLGLEFASGSSTPRRSPKIIAHFTLTKLLHKFYQQPGMHHFQGEMKCTIIFLLKLLKNTMNS